MLRLLSRLFTVMMWTLQYLPTASMSVNVQVENFYEELGAENCPDLVCKSVGEIISVSIPKTL